MGFMGKTHVRAYQAAAAAGLPCQLVAVCDPNPLRLTGESTEGGNLSASIGKDPPERLFDAAAVRGFPNYDDLLASDVSLVSICTYTDSHVDFALRALVAGKHVLVEKPVAIKSEDVERLANAARNARTLCMPAMCMRFWPGWDFLREAIRDGRYGEVRSATFQRLGSGPDWANAFYSDLSRSGGAVVDLHIHDADFIVWCFGKPDSVSSVGDAAHITTQYHYENGPRHVVAEGAWDIAPSAGFRMKYLVNFERATLEFDMSKTPALNVFTAAGASAVPLPTTTGYDGQVRHLVNAIASGHRTVSPTVDQALTVARLLEAEIESALTKRQIRPR